MLLFVGMPSAALIPPGYVIFFCTGMAQSPRLQGQLQIYMEILGLFFFSYFLNFKSCNRNDRSNASPRTCWYNKWIISTHMEEKPSDLRGKIYIFWTVDLDVHLRQCCLNALCLICRQKQYVDITKLNGS